MKRLALVDDESAFVRADAELARVEVESARKALNQAIENFKNFEEFKEEIFEGGFASYCIRYKDGRDALYPDLDLSSIISPIPEDGVVDEEVAPIQDVAPNTTEDKISTTDTRVLGCIAAIRTSQYSSETNKEKKMKVINFAIPKEVTEPRPVS